LKKKKRGEKLNGGGKKGNIRRNLSETVLRKKGKEITSNYKNEKAI